MSAAFAGARHDGGASDMRKNLSFWKAGLEGKIPEGYQEYARQYEKEIDPVTKDSKENGA